ncbi:MAG: right-handed parallel beta-helix repeat-containing protein [Candidatus Riflebacteria bacterium]|nr:right-handed parallel beta-helix repeat-containing protein [Candidatus Riflebacteria bacterium]
MLFKRNRFFFLAACLLIIPLFYGCGIRASNTGGLLGRVFNPDGDVVPNAVVYSLFREDEKVTSGLDGSFNIPELPAGRNNIVITHPSYKVGQEYVEVVSNQLAELPNIKLEWATASLWISDFQLESVSSSSAKFIWKTQKPVICTLEYGLDTGYGTKIHEQKADSTHEVTITGLKSETLYHARSSLVDEKNVTWYSYDLSFKTTPDYFPTPPTRVYLSPLSNYSLITVNWDFSPSSIVKGYRVFRSENGSDWLQISGDDIDSKTNYFTDRKALGGKFYTYGVRALSGDAALSAITTTKRIFMPGYIEETTTLTASDSPIELYSDIIVRPGVNLYVEPGVEFRIASQDAFRLGFDTERVEFLVQGFVSLQGLPLSPIKFVPLEIGGKRDLWAGIHIQAGETGDSLFAYNELSCCKDWGILVENCNPSITDMTVKFSGGGMKLSGVRSSPPFTNLKFNDIASTAIEIRNCTKPSFQDVEITQAGAGLRAWSNNYEDQVTFKESRIEAINGGIFGFFNRSVFNNLLVLVPDGTGVDIEVASSTENILDHCTIDANIGVVIASGNPIIENNIIFSSKLNGKSGIKYLQTGVPQFPYNDINGFTTAYDGCAAGEGAAVFKPDFVGGVPFDYNLLTTSPLKRNDRNGLEMGRYGTSFFNNFMFHI